MNKTEVLKILSPQELRVFQRKARGQTRAETAVALGVGRNHVKNLIQSARRKLRIGLPANLRNRYLAILICSPQRPREVPVASLSDCVNI